MTHALSPAVLPKKRFHDPSICALCKGSTDDSREGPVERQLQMPELAVLETLVEERRGLFLICR